jgi:FkbM family methyltransferase
VFRLRTYDTGLPPETVRRIVDVGGNVGYSCLFWCSTFPHAHVLAYEPHPVHCEILNWHIEANAYSDRVTLIPAGAASKASTATLVDDGIRSTLVHGDGPGSRNRPVIEIKTVDFFETVGQDVIDILKIDIEGGEYELLQDSRFEDLSRRVRCIVMEWHKRAPHHLGGKWCEQHLTKMGMAVADAPEPTPTQDIGTLLAFRR